MNKVIMFSKDRAMQCDASLRSFYKYCTDKDTKIIVLYKTSNKKHAKSYDVLKEEYLDKNIWFMPQGDFKTDILSFIEDSDFITFLVDDNLFIGNFSLSFARSVIEFDENNVLGFSFRMGENIENCYPISVQQLHPNFIRIRDVLYWNWILSEYDWNYPMDISSSMHKVDFIKSVLMNANIQNPNELEYFLDAYKGYVDHQSLMACYKRSVAFCNPINKVNTGNNNRSGDNPELSTEKLLEKFIEGYRINIDQYDGFIPLSPHQEVDVEFTK